MPNTGPRDGSLSARQTLNFSTLKVDNSGLSYSDLSKIFSENIFVVLLEVSYSLSTYPYITDGQ